MNSVLCPHCGKNVEINEALRHHIEAEVKSEAEAKYKKELAVIQKTLEEKALSKAREEMDLKVKDKQNELLEVKEQSQKLREQLLDLTKTLRDLKEKDENRELEMQKQLMEARQKMEEQLSKNIQAKADLTILELKKQLDDTQKALEDAKRKSEQKSQQLQGEVLELNLESHLAEAFPLDEIIPVPKGIEGADVMQKIKNKFGQVAGIILWETKRTKLWSKSWTAKLRENVRQSGASAAVLVSDVLPDEVTKFGKHEQIWVSCYEYAIPLAYVLRDGIMKIAQARSTAAHKDEKLEDLFTYITADGFRHRFEAQVESILELRKSLDLEQSSMKRIWKVRETQIIRMRDNLASMYGELQGIMGPSLPAIPSLDIAALPEGESVETKN